MLRHCSWGIGFEQCHRGFWWFPRGYGGRLGQVMSCVAGGGRDVDIHWWLTRGGRLGQVMSCVAGGGRDVDIHWWLTRWRLG